MGGVDIAYICNRGVVVIGGASQANLLKNALQFVIYNIAQYNLVVADEAKFNMLCKLIRNELEY